MHLSKTKRKALRQQFKGCCAYCGASLPAQGWHAESIGKEFVEEGVVPVCTLCRKIKGNASPEEFRALLAEQVEKALRHSINFRTAMHFGLVSQQTKKVEFWFQRCNTSRKPEVEQATETTAGDNRYSREHCPVLTVTGTVGNSL